MTGLERRGFWFLLGGIVMLLIIRNHYDGLVNINTAPGNVFQIGKRRAS